MECSNPGAVRDEELFAYLAGEEIRPAATQHFASCPSCSSRLATYRTLEIKLLSKLYRWDCPPNQVLGEYQLGLLSEEYSTKVRDHLRMCVLCTAEVAILEDFLLHDPLLAPQVAAVRPSLNHHRPTQDIEHLLDEVRARSLAGVRRIVATLVPPQPQYAFQRGLQIAEWPRRYTAEDMSISLQLESGIRRSDTLQLIGLVTRKGLTLESLQGTTVQLLSQANTVYTQSVDELGNFVFSSIPPATYTLELQFLDSTVVIEQLPVHPTE